MPPLQWALQRHDIEHEVTVADRHTNFVEANRSFFETIPLDALPPPLPSPDSQEPPQEDGAALDVVGRGATL